MPKNLKTGIILGTLLFGVIGIASFVQAASSLPTGGEDFDSAVTIEPGKYTTDRDLDASTYEFFKINVQAGQMLKIKLGTTTESYAGAAIYDADEEKVDYGSIIAEANASETINWSPSTSGILYLSIGNEYDVNAQGSRYDISLEDHFDANSKTDAGDSIKNALTITPGEHKSYLAGEKGTDNEDFYEMAVKKGDIISIKATPNSKELLGLKSYNDDQEILEDELAEDDGAAVSITSPVEKSGNLYFAVSSSFSLEPEPIQYTLSVKKETSLDEEEAVSIKDKDQEDEETLATIETKNVFQKKFLGLPLWAWILIIFSLVSLVIILILWLIFRKKKPAEPEYVSGTKEANKPTVGYKHPCKYCDQLISPNSNVCPHCKKVNPQGPLRCPKCHEPTEKDWQTCSHCNLPLRITCSKCGKNTFFGDYCEHCAAHLTVTCPHCQTEQPPIGDKCTNCGKKL